jgi:ketosteroid isomerase-like protein
MARSTQQVFEDHGMAIASGDMDKLMADYAEDAILLTLDGCCVGKEAIQAFFEETFAGMPNAQITPKALAVEGDTLIVHWSADSDTVSIPDGVDTLVIRDDKIQRQTAWFQAVPK